MQHWHNMHAAALPRRSHRMGEEVRIFLKKMVEGDPSLLATRLMLLLEVFCYRIFLKFASVCESLRERELMVGRHIFRKRLGALVTTL